VQALHSIQLGKTSFPGLDLDSPAAALADFELTTLEASPLAEDQSVQSVLDLLGDCAPYSTDRVALMKLRKHSLVSDNGISDIMATNYRMIITNNVDCSNREED
jgi:hypothetical protein